MNKPLYLGLPLLKISKIVMYEFWYNFVKLNIQKKENYVTWIQTAL